MNLLNALGFFVLGLAMTASPELVPALVPATAGFGEADSLWLEFMGAVMFLIGSAYTAKCLAAELPKPAPRGRIPAAALANAHTRSTIASSANRATA